MPSIKIKIGKKEKLLHFYQEDYPYCCANFCLADWYVGNLDGDSWWVSEADKEAPSTTGSQLLTLIADTLDQGTYLVADVRGGVADKHLLAHIKRRKTFTGKKNRAKILYLSPFYKNWAHSGRSKCRTLLFTVEALPKKKEAKKV